jgi:hypothetical protein
MESIIFYFEKYEYTFKSPIKFCFLSKINPSNYYMEKCNVLIDKIFNKDIKIIESGEGGRHDDGYIWNTHKYVDDSIQINFCLIISHENNDIKIKLDYVESKLMLLFIENLVENLKDRFLNEQTIYTKIIKTNIKNMDDEYYVNNMIKINNYFKKPIFVKKFINRSYTLNTPIIYFLYTKDYLIDNYDIQVQVIVSEYIIHIYIDSFNNKLNKIGFDMEDFENYLKNNQLK